MRDIRTDVGVYVGSISAGAVVVEAREVIAIDQPEVVLDGALATTVVGTEPGGVSGRFT